MLSKPIHLSEIEESGISCVGVKSGDLRRNAKSEGSSLGPYRRWGVKAWRANGIRYPGAAWLSPARVVRCLVKSYNERNPRFVLLRHAPKEKVFATEFPGCGSDEPQSGMGGLGNQELPLYSAFSYKGYRVVPVSRLGFDP
ncbi:hypothetical protein AgCh_012527 [Apium graveolens]